MDVVVSGKNLKITEALDRHVRSRFEKLKHHSDDLISAHVVLAVGTHHRHEAEATLRVPGESLFADATENDMYAAVNDIAHKLMRQLQRHKEKRKSHP